MYANALGEARRLRVLADRRPRPARFLAPGSASPDLLRQSSESLAVRIACYTLGGLGLGEVGHDRLGRRRQSPGGPARRTTSGSAGAP